MKSSQPKGGSYDRRRKRIAARQNRKRRKKDPQKVAARNAVNHAIRDGKIVPPPACEECGHDFSDFKREAHHEDYSRPLVVVWLCALCHRRNHRIDP